MKNKFPDTILILQKQNNIIDINWIRCKHVVAIEIVDFPCHKNNSKQEC